MKLLRLIVAASKLWFKESADQYAASLAYYIIFAITPLILLSISLVGMVIGSEKVALLLTQWGNNINPDLTELLDTSVQNFSSITTAYYVPIIALIFFSTVVVVALNSVTRGLHGIWHIEITGWKAFIQRLIRSIMFILMLQIYLVFVIFLDSIITIFVNFTGLEFLNIVTPILFLLGTIFLLTLGYGLLPLRAPVFHARLAGAVLAGFLFLFFRELVVINIGIISTPDIFGAAGIIVLLLVWVYVGASIIFYGAAFAKVYEDDLLQATD